jgi:RNA polymerase sigma factor (sigma-70 family)
MLVKNLIEKAKAGDKAAENQIFKFLFDRFAALAKRRVGKSDALDIAQTACLVVLEKYKTGSPPRDFEAWAYGVLRNTIGNYYQSREAQRRVFVADSPIRDAPAKASRASDAVLQRHLRDCFRKMIKDYPRYARVLNLAHQGYETDEICMKLKVRRDNLYNLLNRGRRLLRNLLERGTHE